MSGIFGIFNRNGRPVEEKTVNSMLDAMSYWEPDDSGRWIDGSVALGHSMLWNTPESKYERLPLEKDTYILTMDARIDNRDELEKEIELPDKPLSETGDSEFILGAYKKWGEECPKHLLGDFAFVIWDEEKQKLFCARDPLGIKLFHYYLDDGLFVFSSDTLGVLSHPSVPKDYDEETFSIFFQENSEPSFKNTFFDKIKKLPSSTSLVITEKEIREKAYWHIENSPQIYYDTYQGYVDALKSLLQKAVEARIRTDYDVTSHLSGGIDSSPIAVLAARKLRESSKALHAYNWINIPREGEEYEEVTYEFSRRIATLEKIKHHEFAIDTEDMVEWYDEHNILTQGTMLFLHELYVQKKAMSAGSRTILSGWGGDEFISYNGYSYIKEFFKKRKFLSAFKVLYKEKKYRGYSWYRFAIRCVKEMDIPLLRDYIKWKNNKIETPYKNNYYEYITENFKKIMMKYPAKEFPDLIGIRNRQRMLLDFGHIQHRIESWALSALPNKIEYTYPLLDRRIVEFAFGIPEEMFFHKEGHKRHLMRSVVEDLLPHDIAWSPKIQEVKVNATYKKQYTEALEKWYNKHKDDNLDLYENSYVEYKKILDNLELFDFTHSDSDLLHDIVLAVLVANVLKIDTEMMK